METLFENHYTLHKANVEEMYTNVILKRPIMYVIFAIEGACVLLNIVNVFVFGSMDFTTTIIAAAIAVTVFVMLKIASNKTVRQMCELNEGEPPEVTTEVFEDGIKVFSRRGSNEMSWPSFKKALLTKNLILLLTKENVVFTLSKGGFTKGTYQGFCELLKGKGLIKK
jgi:hypothetical protein